MLDSVPGEVNSEDSSDEVEKVLHTLKSLPSHPPSRKYTLFPLCFSILIGSIIQFIWLVHVVL